MMIRWVGPGLLMVSAVLLGCSSEDGDRDFAGAVTGPGVETTCLKRQNNLERFPSTIGDTDVTVNCAPSTATP